MSTLLTLSSSSSTCRVVLLCFKCSVQDRAIRFPRCRYFPKQQIEPSGARSSSSRGGGQSSGAGGTGRGTGSGAPGTNAAGRGTNGAYCYDPWGGWVLENYSLYTTVMAAFVRKAGNMSFKVRRGISGSPQKVFRGVCVVPLVK